MDSNSVSPFPVVVSQEYDTKITDFDFFRVVSVTPSTANVTARVVNQERNGTPFPVGAGYRFESRRLYSKLYLATDQNCTVVLDFSDGDKLKVDLGVPVTVDLTHSDTMAGAVDTVGPAPLTYNTLGFGIARVLINSAGDKPLKFTDEFGGVLNLWVQDRSNNFVGSLPVASARLKAVDAYYLILVGTGQLLLSSPGAVVPWQVTVSFSPLSYTP